MTDILKRIQNLGDSAANAFKNTLGKYSSPFGSERSQFSNDGSKYDVQNLSYPLDLFSSDSLRYGGHYTVFYINVAEDSKLLTNTNEKTVSITDDERLRSSINQIGITSTGAIAASAGLGKIAGTILSGLGGAGGSVAPLLAGAAATTVSAAAGGKMSRQQKRLKSAIALHTPNALNVRYSTSWGEEETGAFQAASMLTEGGMKALTESVQNGSANTQSLTGPAASVATALSLNVPGGIGSGLSAASGLVSNPKKEQLFKGVDFRSFSFEYQFAPRDERELENVNRIINTFKYHMHPEFKDASSFIFAYPSEFDIHYYFKESENKYLHRHTSCVLKDVNINYTPNGAFTSFNNGAPTQITLQLTFLELAILTKDQISQGY